MGLEPTQPNAENCSVVELDVACGAAPSRRAHDRVRAIKSLIMGIDHDTTAELFDVSRRTLFNWVRRFNEAGIDGLLDRPRAGRPRKIDSEHSSAVRDRFESPASAGHRHWTARKFHGYLNKEVGLEVGYSTLVRWQHEQNFRLKVPQPWPDRQDEELREAFVKRLRAWVRDADVELWFQDEMGVEGDPRPRRRWAKKGERTRGTKNGDHIRLNASGMICPRTGEAFALSFTHSDRDCFQRFIDIANQTVKTGRRRNLLIMDFCCTNMLAPITRGST